MKERSRHRQPAMHDLSGQSRAENVWKMKVEKKRLVAGNGRAGPEDA